MPVRSHGKLLAGLAALLGLSLAGCQSRCLLCASMEKIRNTTIEPAPAAVCLGLPRYVIHERVPSATSDKAATATPSPSPSGLALTSGQADNTSVIASSWHPVTHIGAEGSPDQQTESTPAPPLVSTVPAPLPELRPVASSNPGVSVPASLQSPDGISVPIASTGRVTTEEPPTQLPMPRSVQTPAAPVAPLVPVGPGGPLPAPPSHGLHYTPNVPREGAKQALPPYIVEPPDVLLIQASTAVLGPKSKLQEINGSHLVRPDGTVDLGIYGQVFVAGMTLDEIRTAVAIQLQKTGARTFREPEKNADGTEKKDGMGNPVLAPAKPYSVEQIRDEVRVDVISYNSKAYYVVTSGAGYGEAIFRVPITGNETVMDALSYIQGLPVTSSMKKIWLARSTKDPQHPMVMPIDYKAVAHLGAANTNYQLFPGDRIYVGADPWLSSTTWVSKRLNFVDRILGTALLGGTAYNVLTNRTTH
jgi:polysaccharide export outer membrane protein